MKKTTKQKGPKKAGDSEAKAAAVKAMAATKAKVVKNRTAATGAEAGAEQGKADKAKGEGKPKRVSALDAAVQVLAKTGRPMRAQELIAAMAEQGLWSSPAGKTPAATLYAAMLREARDKGDASRFRKVGPGQFEFAGKVA